MTRLFCNKTVTCICASACLLLLGCKRDNGTRSPTTADVAQSQTSTKPDLVTADQDRIARYTCPKCEIQVVHDVDFGEGEDAPAYGQAGKVRRDARGYYWIPNTYRPGTVAVYSAQGTFVQAVGKEGSGPREIRYVNAIAPADDGGMYIVDNRNSRISFADSSLHIVSSIRPDAQIREVVRTSGGGFVINGQSRGSMELLRLSDEGRFVATLDQRAELKDRDVSRDPKLEAAQVVFGDYVIAADRHSGKVYAGNAAEYRLIEFSADSVTRILPGGIDWFQRAWPSEHGRGPRLLDSAIDSIGRLWVLLSIPDISVNEDLFRNHDPSKFLSPAQMDASGDAVIEVWDLSAGKLLAGVRLNQYLWGLADATHPYALIETPDGDRKVRVWTLNLSVR